MPDWDPWANNDRVCRISIPHIPDFGGKKRDIGVYISGALFALGWWFFFDAVAISTTNRNSATHIRFDDWIPGILSTIGMITINLIDKSRLSGDDFSYSGSGAAWKARLFLFVGFALLAGGLAGSVTVFVLKYILNATDVMWYGITNVIQSALIMMSCFLLWLAQNTESDYTYNLTL